MHGTQPTQHGLSCSEPQWEGLFLWAKVIPRLCHNINRVVYVFGGKVEHRISQITPTLLCPPVLDQLRAADCIVNDLLREYSLLRSLSQVRWLGPHHSILVAAR